MEEHNFLLISNEYKKIRILNKTYFAFGNIVWIRSNLGTIVLICCIDNRIFEYNQNSFINICVDIIHINILKRKIYKTYTSVYTSYTVKETFENVSTVKKKYYI